MSQPQHNPLVSPPTPPSGLSTPSEMPGTPNSTTTSMSALSTVAIKDGHRGSAHPHAYPFSGQQGFTSNVHPSPSSTSHTSMLAAERADRISRLPGFAPNMGSGARTKSTVGSASATGSVGRTVDGSLAGEEGSSVTEGGSDFGGMDVDDYERGSGSQADTDMAVDGVSERPSTVGGGSQYGGSNMGSQAGGYERGGVRRQDSGAQQAERILRSSGMDAAQEPAGRGMATPEGEGLGKFYFEDKPRH